MFTRVLPAIIAGNQEDLDDMLRRLKGNVEWVMLDFMDGSFVASTALMFDVRLQKGLRYEAHLMVKKPLDHLPKLKGKVETVIIHVESDDFPQAIKKARSLGFEVAAAINPGTPLEKLEPSLKELDRVLVMTVEPGRYGAPFVPGALETVKKLRKIAPALPIEVDGAMNPENAKKARAAGANIFASGSYLMKSSDLPAAIRTLQEAVK
ncbi:MAG: ribulose-phosphate 3-epimerase [Candidatus Bathyarchaeota archaeon]|nr:ribulose-phosphate 3-epimerase [Candidatus Bathyarchaeota archaeon]